MPRGSMDMVRGLQSLLHVCLQLTVLCCLLSMVWAAEMCTKSVPVQREPSKKVHVLRRVPASCSNWEKAWSWITKKDCGTKYRLDLVDIPSQKVITYRTKKVCCEGDLQCKQAEANGLESAGMNVSDEKFLAIVLGSTAAALFVLILVISISLCRKKKQCSLLCEERRHIYANAEDAEESSELQGQKGGCGGGVDEDETENKVCESEYAEINDSGLPRYTDIFKEAGAAGDDDDPFTRATAPPLCTYEAHGAEGGITPDPDDSNVKEVLQGTADILQRESQQQQQRLSQQQQQQRESQQQQQQRESQKRESSQQQQQQQQQQKQQQHKQKRQQDQGDIITEETDMGDYYNLAQSAPSAASSAAAASSSSSSSSSSRERNVREEAVVLSLTKDDPAVVTGKASAPPSSSSASSSSPTPSPLTHPPPSSPPPPPPQSESASCDVKVEKEDHQPCPQPEPVGSAVPAPAEEKSASSSAFYDCLGDKDSHEYQRLISRQGPSEDLEMKEVGQEGDVEFVADEATTLTNGQVEKTASC